MWRSLQAPEPRGVWSASRRPRPVPTVETDNVSFSCIGVHGGGTGGDPIYKVMSRQRLSDNELDAFVFERRSSHVVRADWNASGAYTKLEPSTGWPPFVLRNRLFYANMESPVSCMETQIVGKNAALLVAEAAFARMSCVTNCNPSRAGAIRRVGRLQRRFHCPRGSVARAAGEEPTALVIGPAT